MAYEITMIDENNVPIGKTQFSTIPRVGETVTIDDVGNGGVREYIVKQITHDVRSCVFQNNRIENVETTSRGSSDVTVKLTYIRFIKVV